MKVVLRVYLTATVISTLSCGTITNVKDFSGDFDLNKVDTNVDNRHNLPFEHENAKEIDTYSSSCPINPKPADCAEVFENGFKNNGVYKVNPRNKILSCGEIRVYCDMKTDGGGWTVIQRRGNFGRSSDYFNKTWNEYKIGFGILEKDFWLGNDYIYALTNQKRYSVRFDLATNNETAHATYDSFWTENEELKYRLFIKDYRGNAGDSMAYHQGQNFSTKDRINNPERYDFCASTRGGGWWYKNCAEASLNGMYLTENYTEGKVNSYGIYWTRWKHYKVSLLAAEIKIRPFDYEFQ